jgi:hypothetical protein
MSIRAAVDRRLFEGCEEGGRVMDALGYVLRGLLVVLGRMIAHLHGARREADARRRELRLHALVDAWRKIGRGARDRDALDEALVDLQLFGTSELAERAARVAASREEGVLLDDLLEELRDDLRDELHLSPLACPLVRVRRAA